MPLQVNAQRSSVYTVAARKVSTNVIAATKPLSVNLARIGEEHQITSRNKTDIVLADAPLTKRRPAIRRQMHHLFIYPITYLMVGTVPFVFRSSKYSDKYAANPIAIVALLSTFCVTIAGTVDCVVFGWREKPWQHVSEADCTFLGSSKLWTFTNSGAGRWTIPAPRRLPSLGRKEEKAAGSSKKSSRPIAGSRVCCTNNTKQMVPLHKKTCSGISDRATRVVEGAAANLALERADRQNRMSTRDHL